MKNLKLILSPVKLGFILLILLINSGCATAILLEKVVGTSENEDIMEHDDDVINRMTAAYLTPNQDLVVCLNGFYEGQPPAQDFAFRVFNRQFTENLEKTNNIGYFTVPRSQVVYGCPYADNEGQGWKPVKVETILTDLTRDQLASLRPLPGTHETIYNLDKKDKLLMIYYTSDAVVLANTPVILLQTATIATIRRGKSDSQPFKLLYLPFTLAIDVVTSPIQIPAFIMFCVVLRDNHGCSIGMRP